MSDLTTELQTYQRLLPTLLAHQGQFAVISGEQLLIRGLSSNFSFHPSGWFQFIRHRRLPTMLMPASNTMSA